MGEVVFLELDDILLLHSLAINKYGGSMETRDVGLVDSAISQPKATFDGEFLHSNIHEMAAAYFFHISQNQGFADGNKRTGFLAIFSFLELNGYELTISDDDLWETLLTVARGEMEKNELSEFLSNNSISIL